MKAPTLIFLLTLIVSNTARSSEPSWIWVGQSPIVYFRQEIDIQGSVDKAALRVTADFAEMEAYINGEPAGAIEGYDPTTALDVRPLLKPGKNVIDLRAESAEGPAAAAISLEVQQGEKVTRWDSGQGWQGAIDKATWKPVDVLGPVPPHRWSHEIPEMSAFEEYNQWKDALLASGETAKLSPLPAGFEIELLRTAKEEEGSWVSCTFDPNGDLLVAREKQGILRFKLGKEIQVAVAEDTLLECRGMAFHEGYLYANANNTKALYRLKDADGDGKFEELTPLRPTEGGVGHGRNDIAVGPDGLIYSIHGDDIRVPEGSIQHTTAEPEGARELGHLARLNKDGTWEVFNRGLRNPYGVAFNEDGEAFTYDADNEGDIGLPLYRPTRVNHLVSGANYGWQQALSGKSWPVYAPDSVPTTLDIGRGSPTAAMFGTKSNFPLKYRQALFILDWSYGRIIALHLSPRGGSYHLGGEVFLKGRPLNVTDLDFGPDGAMYFTTGGRKTQSALYRIKYTGPMVKEAGPGPHELGAEEFSKTARELRRKLESHHLAAPDAKIVEEVWPHLGSADPWIRNAARVALERQPVELWKEKALTSKLFLDGLTGLLALSRRDEASRPRIVERLSPLDFTHGQDRTEVLTVLRIYEHCRVESLPAEVHTAILMGEVASLDRSLNREWVKLMVASDSPYAVANCLTRLAAAPNQSEKLHYLELLSRASRAGAAPGWTPERKEVYFRTLAQAKKVSRGDRFLPAFFKDIETRVAGWLPEEEKAKFTAILAQPFEAPPAPAPRPMVKHWQVADLPKLEGGDAKAGKALYDAALCSRCHQFGSLGTPVGPDLSQVASRFSRRDLLESIIEPSKVVAEVYQTVLIAKKDGSVITGRVIQDDFRESKLYISSNPFAPADLTEILKQDIASVQELPVSPMPVNLLDTLTEKEILDLLAYLEAGAQL